MENPFSNAKLGHCTRGKRAVLKWKLRRMVEVHTGRDGYVRVAYVRTSSGVLRRPIHNLSPLPCEVERLEQEDTISNAQNSNDQTEPIDDRSPEPSTSTTQQPSKKRKSYARVNPAIIFVGPPSYADVETITHLIYDMTYVSQLYHSNNASHESSIRTMIC